MRKGRFKDEKDASHVKECHGRVFAKTNGTAVIFCFSKLFYHKTYYM